MSRLLQTSDFDFPLPDELVAQRPPAERGRSRLMVVRTGEDTFEHTTFSRLPSYLRPGDLLVLNDTRVFPARLLGHRVPSGGAVECLLLGRREIRDPGFGIRDSETDSRTSDPESRVASPGSQAPDPGSRAPDPGSRAPDPEAWDALMHPGQKLKPGARVVFEGDGPRLHGEVLGRHFHGRRTVRLWTEDGTAVASAIERIGHVPLPPYIARADEPADRERYQTVYARDTGSIAAPTAGLHFTTALLEEIRAAGVELTRITLHVGYGTFRPVRVERVEEHEVDPERYAVSIEAARALTRARQEGRRIIAVGTTTTRALESVHVQGDGTVLPASGSTRVFIYPGHVFRLVGGLVTNFHLPRSSLLMLVAAFAGRERILAAYREAVEHRYRFYSYGDAMLIL